MLDHPEVKAFTEPLEKWWKKRKTRPSRQRPGDPVLQRAVQDDDGAHGRRDLGRAPGPLSFAIYDVPMSDQHKLDLVLTSAPPTARSSRRRRPPSRRTSSSTAT
jgi:hypothetical protein